MTRWNQQGVSERNQQWSSIRKCVIAGGGPAGMVAGLLLARCGVPVVVLEKHADFLRDFRGDTIHPSTLQLLDELGLMSEFEKINFSTVSQAQFPSGDGSATTVVNLAKLRHPYPFIAMAPQWDFLNLLARAGEAEDNFELRMNCQVLDVLSEGDRIVGVRYSSPDGIQDLKALLTIAADGRWSRVRDVAGIAMKDYSVPLDVWWFKVPGVLKRPNALSPAFAQDKTFVLIPRSDYVQTAMLLPKGMDAEIRAQGVDAWRRSIVEAAPELTEGVSKLSLDDAKLLDVKLNRARRWWRSGLLCIGDAAHAMSPVGGVGINLAAQDAVAAARILAEPLRTLKISDRDVANVQNRRLAPTIVVQSIQRLMHLGLRRVMRGSEEVALPASVASLLRRFPKIGVIPARLLAVGVIQEHSPLEARRTAGNDLPG